MIRTIIVAASLATATAAGLAQQPRPPAAPASAIDPARLAAARRFVDASLPEAMLEQIVVAGIRAGAEAEIDNAEAARLDPHHAERARIVARIAVEEATRIMRELDPSFRALFSEFYARRFTLAELEESAFFYASPAGRRLTAGGLSLALSPEYDRAMESLEPSFGAAFAGIGERLAAATAHLPPWHGMPAAGPPQPEAAAPVAPDAAAAARAAPAAYPGPPADPVRLAAARRAIDAMWPTEAVRRPLNMLPALEMLIATRIADFGLAIPPEARIDANATIGEIATGFDPHFPRRLPVLARFAGEEYSRLAAAIDPEWRRVMAEAYAREFSAAELDEFARFYATPTGRRLAIESYRAPEDPQLVRGTILLIPRVLAQMPAIQRRIEQATAHLPPPPSPLPPLPVPGRDDPDGDAGPNSHGDESRED